MEPRSAAWFADFGNDEAVSSLRFVSIEEHGVADVDSVSSISPDFLDVVLRGPDYLERLRSAEIKARLPDLVTDGKSARTIDVTYSIRNRAKMVLCPFTATWQHTCKTIGSDAYWYERGNNPCVILQMCSALVAGGDSAYIFIYDNIVLYFKSLITAVDLRNRITTLALAVRQNADLIPSYLDADATSFPLAYAEMQTPHFCHYVWNSLSGWAQLPPAVIESVDLFITWKENHFIGYVTELFPEIGHKPLLVVDDEGEFMRTVCERGLFVAFAKDVQLTERLGLLVVQFARRTCPKAELDALDRLRDGGRKVILFGLRLGNRAWLSQEEGFVQLARWLKARHGSVSFVIDGMSQDTTKGWTHSLMSMTDERDVATRIASAISSFAPCLSTVGATMAESIVGCAISDVYVAPAGSGMAKYKWIVNKPGVVISNSTVLDKRNGAGWSIRVFEDFRENILPSSFIGADDVIDVIASNRDEPSHANFELDWELIAPVLGKLIDEY